MAGELVDTKISLPSLPQLFAPNADAARRYVEFFAANIRNPHSRRAYARAASEFASWCSGPAEISELRDIEPLHVAAYIEVLGLRVAPPSVKQSLAAIRMLFDWLVVGQVLASNPAAPVRGPRYSVKKGKTPVLAADEARALLDSIDTATLIGLRDKALIGLMVYSFARISAALTMTAADVYIQKRRTWVRLHEKGGKVHDMPCHHNLENYLSLYMTAAGLTKHPKSPLFRTALGRSGNLTGRAMSQRDAHAMIRRRAAKAGITTTIGNHSFRAQELLNI